MEDKRIYLNMSLRSILLYFSSFKLRENNDASLKRERSKSESIEDIHTHTYMINTRVHAYHTRIQACMIYTRIQACYTRIHA